MTLVKVIDHDVLNVKMTCRVRQCIVEAKSMLEGVYSVLKHVKGVSYFIIDYIVYYYITYISK